MGKTNDSNSWFIMNSLSNFLGKIIKRIFQKIGFNIIRRGIATKNSIYNEIIHQKGIYYIENPEVGCKNFSEKLLRVKKSGDFEWPNRIALNQAITRFIGHSKKIVNIGAGTGIFEWFASVDTSLHFTASEFDVECVDWCKKNRSRPNIDYCSKSMLELISSTLSPPFDLAVSVDVIEHVKDYVSFLKNFSLLANKAIITTPNRDRDFSSSIRTSPEYYQHVREWDAGEFFYLLKCFYAKVKLYAMPNVFVPDVVEIGFLSTMTPLIAVCTN